MLNIDGYPTYIHGREVLVTTLAVPVPQHYNSILLGQAGCRVNRRPIAWD